MSQLVKAITATDTGSRKINQEFSPLFVDVFDKTEKIHELRSPIELGKIYEIGVTLGAKTIVSESDYLHDKDGLSVAIERTKQSIIEACFGEFREDFYRIQNAIYDRDFQKARSLLIEFQDKMFSTK